jgi:hypothetical protein
LKDSALSISSIDRAVPLSSSINNMRMPVPFLALRAWVGTPSRGTVWGQTDLWNRKQRWLTNYDGLIPHARIIEPDDTPESESDRGSALPLELFGFTGSHLAAVMPRKSSAQMS